MQMKQEAEEAVIQVAGSLEVYTIDTYMNGRATTWGVFKAYVVFLMISFCSVTILAGQTE